MALVLKAGVRWKLHGVDEGGLKEVEELIEVSSSEGCGFSRQPVTKFWIFSRAFFYFYFYWRFRLFIVCIAHVVLYVSYCLAKSLRKSL